MRAKYLAVAVAGAALAMSLAATGVKAQESFEGAAKDAWLTGKIEVIYALNRHLNPFAIDTDVDDGVVTLTGTVDSQIDYDLAAELASGVEGVVGVNNALTVNRDVTPQTRAADGNRVDDQERDFATWVADLTTTAAVKSKLIASDSIDGWQIDVTTQRHVVTLEGRVASAEQSELAVTIAADTGDVVDVRNNLIVDPTA